ncbi:expulsion defective family member (exp-2) [Nannochloropsis gaditana]|uniref:Expulsion defective family member (Exp-2) n=1 Tax=Nannochloropsis gaditana TaxID=72520 RepID=W7U6H8_9STRA|nr:expulsion defective family member (exp-2) [Nannochloropsis gaditana]
MNLPSPLFRACIPWTLQEDIDDWRAEHTWRTMVFMTADHMYYSYYAWLYGTVMCTVTGISCIAFVLSTMPRFNYTPSQCSRPICRPSDPGAECDRVICYPRPHHYLIQTELVTLILFIFDYLVRLITVHAVPQRLIYWDGRRINEDHSRGVAQPSPLEKTFRYAVHADQVIDLLVILPYLLNYVISTMNIMHWRLLRITRVLRVLKLSRYFDGGELVWNTLKNSGPSLMLLTLFTIVLTFIMGALAFYYEGGIFKVTAAHPEGAFFRRALEGGEEVSPFTSVPVSAYWVIITATTVGYGDLHPTSGPGRFVAAASAYCGIVFLSLPIAIVVKQFNIAYDKDADDKAVEEQLKKEEEEKQKAGEEPTALSAAEAKWKRKHVRKLTEMREFIRMQMEEATPIFETMWEEFVAKHLMERLQDHEGEMPRQRGSRSV